MHLSMCACLFHYCLKKPGFKPGNNLDAMQEPLTLSQKEIVLLSTYLQHSP